MVSACAQCQNHNWIGWSSWRSNCPTSEVTVGQYPLDIPDGTGVPAWAYQNVVQGDSWNKSLALPQVASGAESTYYGTPTASVSYHISTAGDTGIQTGSVATQTASTSTAVRKSNVGAIVGGAVGGTVLLVLIGVIVWLVIRRRRRTAVDPAVVPSPYYTSPGMGQAGHDQPLPSAVDYGSSYPSASRAHFSDDSGTRNSSSPLRLYDPSDPSTFPRTPEPFGYQSTMMTGSTPSNQHGHSDTTGVGRYRGLSTISRLINYSNGLPAESLYLKLNNKEGQSPCLVAAYLQAPCSSDGKTYNVPALSANGFYSGPESTYYGTPTATVTYYASTSVAATQTQSNAAGSNANVGAIAGGAVGGAVLLALIAVLIWMIIRRRQGRNANPMHILVPYHPSSTIQDMDQTTLNYGTPYPPTSPDFSQGTMKGATPLSPMKLYDPSDPSTFPPTPGPFGYQSSLRTQTTSPSNHHLQSPVSGGGQYSGIAEI
ncbi:hypothetical protein FRB90_011185 [Tulasnella sp. 427]|nr:hypothetical protein FRB90_011185 [Tulasnella sp. 427]